MVVLNTSTNSLALFPQQAGLTPLHRNPPQRLTSNEENLEEGTLHDFSGQSERQYSLPLALPWDILTTQCGSQAATWKSRSRSQLRSQTPASIPRQTWSEPLDDPTLPTHTE